MRTPICDVFGIEFPIFAFSHCRDVVAAVSRAGGFGVLGALAFSPEQLELELKWIDENIDGKPYGVDVVMPASYVGKEQGDLQKIDLEKMIPHEVKKFLEELLEEYAVPPLPDDQERREGLLGWSESGGRALVDVSMKHPIKLIANALGPPPEDVIKRAHDEGVQVAALVGRVDQALKQKAQGVDIIIASGYEAGGHTGEITSMVLTPEVVDAVAPTPVLAAGGSGDQAELPDMDQAAFVAGTKVEGQSLAAWVEEFRHLRTANLALFGTFDDDVLSRAGHASGSRITVRAILWVTAGHLAHHLDVLNDRYL